MSIQVENFVKCVYALQGQERKGVRTSDVALRLKITKAAVTEMSRNLLSRKLLVYEPYKPLFLTDEGRRLALKVIFKHRIWETFLHRTLGISLHEIHREAENLEHQTSDFLAMKLYQYLDQPHYDPHGDPIPDPDGNLPSRSEISIWDCKSGGEYMVSRVRGEDKEFFDFCNEQGLVYNSRITFLGRIEPGEMVHIENEHGKEIFLSKKISENILISKTAENENE